MRRDTIDLLRCPRCRRGALRPDSDAMDLTFGPLRCGECHASFPVAEGVADLLDERPDLGGLQRALDVPIVSRTWERYLRPALSLAVAQRRVDRDSEYLMYRSLLGQPQGPVLDLDSGTAMFSRRLARERDVPPVIALDVSRAMLEEAVAQAREASVRIDFIRAAASELPFADGTLGAVLHSGALHLLPEISRLFLEVGRVLRPGGRYVATTFLPPRFPVSSLQLRLGLHSRSEDALRSSLAAAGLVNFERLLLPPFILVKAEKPPA